MGDPMTMTAPGGARRRRRRAAVATSLAATALGLGLTTGTAEAALRTRTDRFTFTNEAGAQVTCTVESVQDLSEDGSLTVSTALSGPADCTASFMDIAAYERGPDGDYQEIEYIEGRGTFLTMTLHDVTAPIRSAHFVFLDACNCNHSYDLSQPK
jgi:hypothetical protein